MQVISIRKLLALALMAGMTATAVAQGTRSATPPAPATQSAQAKPGSERGAASRAAPRTGSNANPAAASAQPVDYIVAVVNNDVITRRELNAQVQNALSMLAAQKIPAPPPDVLDRQVLERLITERALLQEADRAGIRITEDQLDMAIRRIAEENNMTVEQLRAEVEKDVSWARYRRELRDQIRISRLRELEVDRTIHVSEAEIDAFLAEQARQGTQAGTNAVLHLAQILIRVPEGSSPSQIASLRERAERLRQQLIKGADFAQLAAANSDGEEAMRGGDLGVRPAAGWPELFLRAAGNLQPGQVSEVIQSGNGFHILKVLDRQGGPAPVVLNVDGSPMPVTQHRVRHILIRPTAVLSDEDARQRLQSIRERIVQGQVSFADMARQYSDDPSAPQGGDLGWVSPGETVPVFEQTIATLEPGTVSQPFRSPFGWHIAVVEERRVQDVSREMQRSQARQILFQRKLEPAWVEWTSLVRSRAYVDNRLERPAE